MSLFFDNTTSGYYGTQSERNTSDIITAKRKTDDEFDLFLGLNLTAGRLFSISIGIILLPLISSVSNDSDVKSQIVSKFSDAFADLSFIIIYMVKERITISKV